MAAFVNGGVYGYRGGNALGENTKFIVSTVQSVEFDFGFDLIALGRHSDLM